MHSYGDNEMRLMEESTQRDARLTVSSHYMLAAVGPSTRHLSRRREEHNPALDGLPLTSQRA